MKPEKITIKKSTDSEPEKKNFQYVIRHYGSLLMYAQILLILAIGLFVFVYPKWQEVTSDTEGGLAHWQDKRDQLEDALVDAQKLVKIYNNLDKAEREKLTKILPAKEQVPQLMSQLEALFATEELFVTSMNINSTEEKTVGEKVRALSVEINFSAPQDYYQFRKVIEKLESNVRILSIKSFNYSSDLTDITMQADAFFVGK